MATASNPAVASISRANNATICLINQVRRQHGLHALHVSHRLSRAARRHSRSMVAHRYFEHGDYLGRIRQTGYFNGAHSWSAAENIAWGSGRYATPMSIFRLWMNSSGHRANILNPRFREVGIGIHRGAPQAGAGAAATYTTDFGAKH
ncbi:MAG: CAP domain-containing protein [Thermoleophilaceae bacterium]